MEAIPALKEIIGRSHFSRADLARELKISPQALDVRLNRTSNPRVDTLSAILDILGYRIAFVRKGAKMDDGSYLIGRDAE
jgi:DNA-binding phage protein